MAYGLHWGSCFGCRLASQPVAIPMPEHPAVSLAVCGLGWVGGALGSGGGRQPCSGGRSFGYLFKATVRCSFILGPRSGLRRRHHPAGTGCLVLLFSTTSAPVSHKACGLVICQRPIERGWRTCWSWHPMTLPPEMWSLAAPPPP